MVPGIKFWSWTKHSVRRSSEGKDQVEGKWHFSWCESALFSSLQCEYLPSKFCEHPASTKRCYLLPAGLLGKCSGKGARRPWASHGHMGSEIFLLWNRKDGLSQIS